jgi:peptidoglycan/xylan/chitin deacetylase (PgdA/CDA1 family)
VRDRLGAALAITVDVDGEAGLPGGGQGYAHRLSRSSERVYGVTRGLPRIVGLLDELGHKATFYVPGVTADRHRDEIRSLVELGQDLGHHGHTHRSPDTLTGDEQRREIEAGLASLARLGAAARGYRAPAWELTATTLALLGEYDFAYDSSLMGDDRPYALKVGERSLLELPVHWTLDDAPYFAADPGNDRLLRVWQRELDLAAEEERLITLTLHPDILGRPHRIDVLRRILEHAESLGMTTFTHAEVAATRCPSEDP